MIKGLTLFKRMHSNGAPINSFVLMSWHNPLSITWRVRLAYSRVKNGKTGFYFFRTNRGCGFNFHSGLNLPYFGSLTLRTQPSMFNKGRK